MGAGGSCFSKEEAHGRPVCSHVTDIPKAEAGVILDNEKSSPKAHQDEIINSGQSLGKIEKIRSIRAFAKHKHDAQVNEYIRLEDIRFSDAKTSVNAVPPPQITKIAKHMEAKQEEKQQPKEIKSEAPKPAFKKKFKLTLELDDSKFGVEEGDQSCGDDNMERQTSYKMTHSGTMFVDGLNEGIGKHGIGHLNANGSKLPLKERVAIICKLGAGCSGVVYKALDISPLRLVALKTVPVHDRDKRHQIVREVSALYQMLHSQTSTKSPHSIDHLHSAKTRLSRNQIVDFYDAFSNIDEGGIALMMEYMDGGSLQDIADTGGCSDEVVLANIAMQILGGLSFLHKHRHIHRDMKPANVLIDLSGNVKLSDFGILRQVNPEVDQGHQVATFVGTTAFMAPERIDGGSYSYPSDIWAFGLSMLTLSLGHLPINVAGGFWSILESVRDNPPPRLPPEGDWSDEFRDFIAVSLVRDPAERHTAEQLLEHPFLKKASPDDSAIGTVEESVKELEAILEALYKHLDSIRKHAISSPVPLRDAAVSCLNEEEGGGGKSSVRRTSSLGMSDEGELLSTKDMMRLVLFGEIPNSCSSTDKTVDALPQFLVDVNSCALDSDKDRMNQLAKQLHLPLHTVIRVTESILEEMFT